MTVLEFLETSQYPDKITIDRTNTSKYLFYLTLRAYRQRMGIGATFMTYSKRWANVHKSTMEEITFWNLEAMYALEGFSRLFINGLNTPKRVYVVAETNDGELQEDRLDRVGRRAILKILSKQLNLPYSLRGLLKMDWSGIERFEEFEPVLRRARIEGWDEEELGRFIEKSVMGNPLTLLKRGQVKTLLQMEEQGRFSMRNQLTRWLTQLIHLRVLRNMGTEDRRLMDELKVSWRRLADLMEADKMYSEHDVRELAIALVKYDKLMWAQPQSGVALLVGRVSQSMRR